LHHFKVGGNSAKRGFTDTPSRHISSCVYLSCAPRESHWYIRGDIVNGTSSVGLSVAFVWGYALVGKFCPVDVIWVGENIRAGIGKSVGIASKRWRGRRSLGSINWRSLRSINWRNYRRRSLRSVIWRSVWYKRWRSVWYIRRRLVKWYGRHELTYRRKLNLGSNNLLSFKGWANASLGNRSAL
jgi:hypothetical protein